MKVRPQTTLCHSGPNHEEDVMPTPIWRSLHAAIALLVSDDSEFAADVEQNQPNGPLPLEVVLISRLRSASARGGEGSHEKSSPPAADGMLRRSASQPWARSGRQRQSRQRLLLFPTADSTSDAGSFKRNSHHDMMHRGAQGAQGDHLDLATLERLSACQACRKRPQCVDAETIQRPG